MAKPPKSILNRDFKYRDSASTNLKATFERIRREQKAEIQRRLDRIVSLPERKKANHG